MTDWDDVISATRRYTNILSVCDRARADVFGALSAVTELRGMSRNQTVLSAQEALKAEGMLTERVRSDLIDWYASGDT